MARSMKTIKKLFGRQKEQTDESAIQTEQEQKNQVKEKRVPRRQAAAEAISRARYPISVNTIGKCAEVVVPDSCTGLAEIQDVNALGVTLQWICVSPCYSSQVYSEDMYTKLSKYSFEEIASCENVRELNPAEIQKQRAEYMEQDKPIFERYHALERERRLAMSDAVFGFDNQTESEADGPDFE